MREAGPVTMVQHPGHGIWIDSIIPDDNAAWYGYYHHETPAKEAGQGARFFITGRSERYIEFQR